MFVPNVQLYHFGFPSHPFAVKLFLESGSYPLEKDAVLLTVRPVKIEDRSTKRQFLKFTPPPSVLVK